MVERQIAVVEVIAIRRDSYPIATSVFIHSWQSRFRVRLPRINHVHPVFTRTHFAQVLNTVILLIAVNVVNLLFRKTTFTDRPDGMVQTNMDLFLAYLTIYGQVAFITMHLASYRSAISAACQPTAFSIVSVILFYAKQQFLLLRFC